MTPAEAPDALSSDDERAIGAQLGREPRGAPEVVSRCNLGLPVVVRMPPVLDSGEPFPTRFWMTCPLLHRRIARLEGAGEVRRMDQLLEEDAQVAGEMRAAHERYARERDADLPSEALRAPSGGVAGIRVDADGRAGVKCLHAHTADYLAGNRNPVGERVATQVLPASCPTPCVRPGPDGGTWARASDWSEPERPASATTTR